MKEDLNQVVAEPSELHDKITEFDKVVREHEVFQDFCLDLGIKTR